VRSRRQHDRGVTVSSAHSTRPVVARLGWTLIVLIGAGATLASLAILGLGVLLYDLSGIENQPPSVQDYEVVAEAGRYADSTGVSGHRYRVRNREGAVINLVLPWAASPGDIVRTKGVVTPILGIRVPTESPRLCRAGVPCEP
jgi:hypothetical protein